MPICAIDGYIPERIWSGKEANINHTRIIGLKTWSHVRSHSVQSKLDTKTKECVLVGYPEGVKGYKLWDIKKKLLYNRDVIFEENIFPFIRRTTTESIRRRKCCASY
ncbi:hypothetical protein AVEN_200627-1 [Araneus ventricosus]|uniref:Retroviral polymerase SH3-like domain-containing protein n=1 Tax=Araneus ventricosus TaxID=182803 RepID=A0A4Y2SDP4_ARAVE|nr:hypothetical protein AVEN_200627-1 [Araneus ventricosus]